jgi:hypothetical protein
LAADFLVAFLAVRFAGALLAVFFAVAFLVVRFVAALRAVDFFVVRLAAVERFAAFLAVVVFAATVPPDASVSGPFAERL